MVAMTLFSVSHWQEFCTYDDYNWDWTLQSLQNSCFNGSIKSIILDAPRVYHIGTW